MQIVHRSVDCGVGEFRVFLKLLNALKAMLGRNVKSFCYRSSADFIRLDNTDYLHFFGF